MAKKRRILSKARIRNSWVQPILLTCCSTVLCWLVEGNLRILPGSSQSSLPARPVPEEQGLELLPPQSVPPTFTPEEIPPQGDSLSTYQEEGSNQIILYRLDVGDQISISVPDFPEFSAGGPVDVEGNFFVPILGRIAVKGLTLDETETKIRYELGRRFLKEQPDVVAVLTAPRPVKLTVIGEVVRPGFYSVAPNTTLNELLIAVGGSTPKADLRAIVVRRPLVDGTIIEERVDLYTPLISGKSLPDFQLQGGDTIIISKMEVGQDTGYDRNLIARTTLTQPTITVRVLAPLLPSGVVLRNVTLSSGSNFLDVVASLPIADRLRINVNEVALLRFDPEKGGIVKQTLNPDRAIRGDIAQNVPLEDQDVIIVSRTLFGEVFAAFNIITQPVRDIFGFTNTFIGIANQLDRNR